jgi:hypothetical protein
MCAVVATLASPQDTAPKAVTESRVALVIGNSTYPNVPLKNPANDARDLADALKGLGFSVTLVIDGDLAAMSRAIRDFGNAIKKPDAVALFYFSGHGVQYRGANYLIPAKADIQDADELSFSAVNADQVYAKMESSGDRTNIVILDACRNNPFPGAERASERGLTVVSGVQPPQSLIIYATAPGKTAQDGEGRNGVFTAALLKHIAEPMLDAELMVRRVREDVVKATAGNQVPWHNSSIAGDGFAFAGRGRLLISTDPAGAEVFIDGQRRGVSPLTLKDLPRYSEIEVTARSGSKSAARRLTLTDASEARIELSLQTARGSILVAADEKEVLAMLDGSPVALGSRGSIDGVEVGLHTLELQGDSSGFKVQVEVSAGQTATVKATMVPMGSLRLTLPRDTTCTIAGMGISETTSRYNYGKVHAGRYTLTVHGGDYVSYSETVSIERGKLLDFAPRLRNTVEYLSAKYTIEIERLQKTVGSGAASQADVDDAAVLAGKIRAEDRPELAALADKADTLRGALASLRPATVPSAAVTPAKSTGTLTFTSDPPGIDVVIDGIDTVRTPVSLDLEPGAHSFEPKGTYIPRTFYAAQTLQWITVTAGSEVRVPIRLKAETGRLLLKLVPDGYTVYVNDEEKGVTPLGTIDVTAGSMYIRYEKRGEKARVQMVFIKPDATGTVSWGKEEGTAIPLPRKSIKMNGKPDSWGDMQPIYETDFDPRFLGVKGYGIQRFYICRDDKYLYWRVDFFENNPLWQIPREAEKGTVLVIVFKEFEPGKDLPLAVVKQSSETKYSAVIYDNVKRNSTPCKEIALSSQQSKAMFVARTEIAEILKYCKDPTEIRARLVALDLNYNWVREVTASMGWVDFSK